MDCYADQVFEMKSPFEDMGDEDALTEVEFTLNAFCSQDGTLSVTSDDLTMDPAHPDIAPIGVNNSPHSLEGTMSGNPF